MTELGRKLLPLEHPETATERFAWLARTLRTRHGDPDVRDTARFSQRLVVPSQGNLRPATLNRLETGSLQFTIERCLAYETALCLPQWSLVDPYIYVMREGGEVPRTDLSRTREAGPSELEAILRIGRAEEIEPMDWLRLAYLYRNRPAIFSSSPNLRNSLFERLLADAGESYERNERVMREALVVIGDDIAPLIADSVEASPMRYFVSIEALGYMDGLASWQVLERLLASSVEPFMQGPVLDSVRRRILRGTHTEFERRYMAGRLNEHVIELLGQPSELFAARESALDFARFVGIDIPASERRRLSELRHDLLQLEVRPRSASTDEIARSLHEGVSRAVELKDGRGGDAARLPGLRKLLHNGVFGTTGYERISLGILLGSSGMADEIASAVGSCARSIDSADYGAIRAMVRFATKLSAPKALNPHLRLLAGSNLRDENTLLAVAWALGLDTDPANGPALLDIYAAASSPATKQAVLMAAYRRRDSAVLESVRNDTDLRISREADRLSRRDDPGR